KDFTGQIDDIGKHYKKVQQLTEKLEEIQQKKKPKEHRRCRWALGRSQVMVSTGIRNLKFTNPERKRLIDRVNKTVDTMRSLDRQVNSLEKKIEATRSEDTKKEFRRLQRQHKADLEKLEQEAGVSYQELKRTQREIIQGEVDAKEAKRMDIPVAKVRKVLKIAQEPISLETPIGEEEDSHLGDFIEDRSMVSPAEAVINVNLKDQTAQVLRTLTPREEKVIKMRFGLE